MGPRREKVDIILVESVTTSDELFHSLYAIIRT